MYKASAMSEAIMSKFLNNLSSIREKKPNAPQQQVGRCYYRVRSWRSRGRGICRANYRSHPEKMVTLTPDQEHTSIELMMMYSARQKGKFESNSFSQTNRWKNKKYNERYES